MKKYYLILILIFGIVEAVAVTQFPDNSEGIVISGILVDKEAQPVDNAEMEIYVGTAETVLKADPSKKQGALTPIEGTGKINLSIVGIEGGGAMKLIDGGISNPHSKTNKLGEFRFELTQKFLEGEQILVITSPKNNVVTGITESYPITNKEGEPLILFVEELSDNYDLGKVRLFEK